MSPYSSQKDTVYQRGSDTIFFSYIEVIDCEREDTHGTKSRIYARANYFVKSLQTLDLPNLHEFASIQSQYLLKYLHIVQSP